MKKSLLSLLLVSIVAFGCTPTPSTQPSPSASASSSSTPDNTATPSATPSDSASATPSASVAPSSSSAPVAVTCSDEEPVSGTEYDGSQLGKFICITDAKLNSKWTYSMTAMGITSDVSAQIVSVNGGKYTVRTEVTLNGKTEVKETVSEAPAGYKPEEKSGTKYKYLGKESVNVPAGTFDSYKFSNTTTNNGATVDSLIYISRIRGFVKMNIVTDVPVANMKMSSDVVLKAFQP
jgi:hypothetical protein